VTAPRGAAPPTRKRRPGAGSGEIEKPRNTAEITPNIRRPQARPTAARQPGPARAGAGYSTNPGNYRPNQAELRRAEDATWGPRADSERPKRMRLVSFKAISKGALRGFATVELPIGLTISDVPVLTSNGKSWAALPAKPVLDPDGPHARTDGKPVYAAILHWRDRALSDRFSAAVVDLVNAAHSDALDGGKP
jgi:hypothetical protein